MTKYSHSAKKEALNEYGMKHAWDRCYVHKKLKCYLRSSVLYINKQNAFCVNIDGNKYGIFGTTFSLLRQDIRKTLEQTIFSVWQTKLDLWPNMYQENYYRRVTVPQTSLSRSIRVCGKIRACTKSPCQLVKEREEAEDRTEYALPGSVTPPLQKRE